MALALYFIGTGSPKTRGERSEGGFLIKTDQTTIHVDPGPGAAYGLRRIKVNEIDAIIITAPERGHDAPLLPAKQTIIDSGEIDGVEVAKKPGGYTFRHPDGTLSYLTQKISTRDAKQYAADVLVFLNHDNAESVIAKLKPKLAILTYFTSLRNNPVYMARELQKKTGVQTIAAHDDLTVDLDSYSALSEQKALSKFTKT